jgi:hypothetical protein
LSPDEDARAQRAIDRLVTDKLSLLTPQWDQEEAAFKAAKDQHNAQLSAEMDDDARAAAELQRQRGVLQKELAAGTLARDAFDTKDKQASDAIAAFRKKFDAEAGEWSHLFDQRYRVLLEAARKNSLFAGSDGGGRTWATLATLLTTAKFNNVDPQAWLKLTLERIATGWPNRELDALLPWKHQTA